MRERREPLHPATAATRVAVRETLKRLHTDEILTQKTPVLVALSGGADSLALAAAVAFEAPQLGIPAGAVIVDHNLQTGSAAVAERAASQARNLGLKPVIIHTVDVPETGDGGPEARARTARYVALRSQAREHHAGAVFTAHTRDDQAEQVLLGLARGSGTRSLAGIRPQRGLFVRPFLQPDSPNISRDQTLAACQAQQLTPWHDPHNVDPDYRRVRVRETVLPVLERELGPGIREALATTARLAQQDADLLDDLAENALAAVKLVRATADAGETIGLPIAELEQEPAAISTRMMRLTANQVADSVLTANQTRQVQRLVTHWRGQQEINLPNLTVWREENTVWFQARNETR